MNPCFKSHDTHYLYKPLILLYTSLNKCIFMDPIDLHQTPGLGSLVGAFSDLESE